MQQDNIENLEAASVLPNFESVTDDMLFVFVGTKDAWKRCRTNAQHSNVFRVQAWRVLAWLRVLSHISCHPVFRRIEPSVMSEEIVRRMEALPEQLIESVAVFDNDLTIGIEETRSSDVADVRSGSSVENTDSLEDVQRNHVARSS